MKETELKPCDAPLKASERCMQIRDLLDLQLRFAEFSKTSTIIMGVSDGYLLLDAMEIIIDIVKRREADNEQIETD